MIFTYINQHNSGFIDVKPLYLFNKELVALLNKFSGWTPLTVRYTCRLKRNDTYLETIWGQA